jgi:CHASE2 domain-containing sensor protein
MRIHSPDYVQTLARGFVLSVLALGFYYNCPEWISNWELRTYDFRMGHKSGRPGPEVVIVTIDSRSVSELGGYPLNRKLYTQVTQQLAAAGAKVIGIDINFVKADPEDDAFAAAIQAAGNVVLPELFLYDHPFGPPDEPVKDMEVYQAHVGKPPAEVPVFSSIRPNAARLNAITGKDSAFVNVNMIDDIVVRDAPLAASYRGRFYPTFGVAIVRRYLDVKPGFLELNGLPKEHVQIGGLSVPTDSSATLHINFHGGTNAFAQISFMEVLQGRIPPALFKDKIVLIGVSDGTAHDIWNTPVGFIPGTQIVAHEIDTILSGSGISDIRKNALGLLLIPLMGLAGFSWSERTRPRMIFPGIAAILIVFVAVETLLFARWGIWLAMVYPALVLVASSLWTIHKRLV